MHVEMPGLSVGAGCDIHPDVVFEIDPGAEVVLGDRVSIRRGTTLQANRGSQILVGDDVAIGEHTFISAMVAVVIGSGVGISNQVDVRDHNHVARTRDLGSIGLQPWASGFSAAPIVIEKAALLSNKVTVTAGACIGQNAIVGANSVVTKHVRPNTVVAGAPARAIRQFEGVDVGAAFRPPFSIGWVGTSIMEHPVATSRALEVPWPVPDPGDTVEVTAIETGGFVRSVTDDFRVSFPHLRFTTHNHAVGGATSRDLMVVCRELAARGNSFDVVYVGCGLNDVWRRFQGMPDLAVDLPEFVENMSTCLEVLRGISRRVVYVEETPFGPELEGLPTREMNVELGRFMTAVSGLAAAHGCDLVPVTEMFRRTAALLGSESDLWMDGVHLGRTGDHLLAQLVLKHSRSARFVEHLSALRSVDRDSAPALYRELINEAALLTISGHAR